MKNWPNFFIVGGPRTGTTSLYQYLKKIPGIYMSLIKEPHYFSYDSIPINYYKPVIRDEKKYLDLFSKVNNETIIGEASTSYLSDPNAPSLIHQVSSNAKILISLRDPVEQFYSHYLLMLRGGRIKSSLHDRLQLELTHKVDKSKPNLRIENGSYFRYVKKYLEVFDSKQVKIIFFEKFIKDAKATVQEILRFLNLKDEINNFDNKIYNAYGAPRGRIAQFILRNPTIVKIAHLTIPTSNRIFLRENVILKKQLKPEMNKEDKKFLIKYYLDDVQKLKELLGMELPWPNFKV